MKENILLIFSALIMILCALIAAIATVTDNIPVLIFSFILWSFVIILLKVDKKT